MRPGDSFRSSKLAELVRMVRLNDWPSGARRIVVGRVGFPVIQRKAIEGENPLFLVVFEPLFIPTSWHDSFVMQPIAARGTQNHISYGGAW